MKKIILFTIFLFFGENLIASDITVVITGIKVNQGRIYVGLFNNSKEFPNGRQKAGQFADSETQTIRMIFTGLAAGKYAIAAYQDKNANKKLDTNLVGKPKERYGYTGQRVFGKPDFKDAAIIIKSESQKIEVNIK